MSSASSGHHGPRPVFLLLAPGRAQERGRASGFCGKNPLQGRFRWLPYCVCLFVFVVFGGSLVNHVVYSFLTCFWINILLDDLRVSAKFLHVNAIQEHT